MSDARFQILLTAVVTALLLGFAYIMRATEGATGMSNTVIGAVVYHWLGQSARFARETRKG